MEKQKQWRKFILYKLDRLNLRIRAAISNVTDSVHFTYDSYVFHFTYDDDLRTIDLWVIWLEWRAVCSDSQSIACLKLPYCVISV